MLRRDTSRQGPWITRQISRWVTLFAAVIFIGGKEDREALAYAGRVACHPGIKLSHKIPP